MLSWSLGLWVSAGSEWITTDIQCYEGRAECHRNCQQEVLTQWDQRKEIYQERTPRRGKGDGAELTSKKQERGEDFR